MKKAAGKGKKILAIKIGLVKPPKGPMAGKMQKSGSEDRQIKKLGDKSGMPPMDRKKGK